MDLITGKFFNFFLNYFNLQYNYGLFERIEIGLNNLLSILIIIFIYILLGRYLNYRKVLKYFIYFFLFLNIFYKVQTSYTYDKNFALIFLILDLLTIYFFIYIINNIINVYKKIDLLDFTNGTSIIILISSILVTLNFNYFLNIPSFYFYLIFVTIIFIWLYNFNLDYVLNFKKTYAIGALYLSIPFIPYLFVPAPPDADITTISEIIGYIFQGSNLFNAQIGIKDSWIFIRYPNGLPSFGWIISHLLNIRSSEVLLLLWIFSYFLLIQNLINLANYLKLPIFVIVLFLLNTTINGRYGLIGGQVQEILSYAIGIGMINNLLQKKYILSTLNLSCAILVHPIVSITFIIIYFFYIIIFKLIRDYPKINFSNLIFYSLIFAYPILYYIFLTIGYTDNKSVIMQVIDNISFYTFINNAIGNIQSDTFSYSIFLLIIIYAYIIKFINIKFFTVAFFWFVSSVLVDGLFRNHEAGSFVGSFSIIALWIISLSLFFKIMYEKINIKNIYLKFLPVFLLYLLICFPVINSTYFSVFTTHAEIKVSRYIEANLNKDDLIVNIRPPSEWGPWNFVRGNSAKNTTFARISEHQIKKGVIKQGPNFDVCYNKYIKLKNNKEFQKYLFNCLKSEGATHLLVMSRHSAEKFVDRIFSTPLITIGESYLFKL